MNFDIGVFLKGESTYCDMDGRTNNIDHTLALHHDTRSDTPGHGSSHNHNTKDTCHWSKQLSPEEAEEGRLPH